MVSLNSCRTAVHEGVSWCGSEKEMKFGFAQARVFVCPSQNTVAIGNLPVLPAEALLPHSCFFYSLSTLSAAVSWVDLISGVEKAHIFASAELIFVSVFNGRTFPFVDEVFSAM